VNTVGFVCQRSLLPYCAQSNASCKFLTPAPRQRVSRVVSAVRLQTPADEVVWWWLVGYVRLALFGTFVAMSNRDKPVLNWPS